MHQLQLPYNEIGFTVDETSSILTIQYIGNDGAKLDGLAGMLIDLIRALSLMCIKHTSRATRVR